ncbi:ribosomal-processing cysteine protease Prp [Sporolactobacillus sp. THM7-7]|nr:ribosomal-processing cysteine protease Prp [Sporolactobacillus sp. THM7-7]
MITVKMNRNPDGRISHFRMTGHADSGPYGYDLVCAGVSAVAFGALNAIEALSGVKMKVRRSEAGGFLDCVCPAHPETQNQEKAQLILEAMLVSLRTIEKSYGQYIQIIDKGGADHAET